MKTILLLPILICFISTGCKLFQSTPTSSQKFAESADSSPKICAAIRGNGHYLMAHFGALARISEHYGSMYALAGGSSGTITSFLYESIRIHPDVQGAVDPERGLRTALLLKSVMGYIQALEDSPEAKGILFLLDVVQRAKAAGIWQLSDDQYQEAAQRLLEILKDDKITSLVNPAVLADLQPNGKQSIETYKFKVNEITNALKAFGAFNAEDQRIFFRDGIVSFSGLASAMGRMADFYAARNVNADASLSAFITNCSSLRVQGNKNWQQVAKQSTAAGLCGDLLKTAVNNYRKPFIGGAKRQKTRADDKMGAFIPTIIPTAILYGAEAKKAHDDAFARYVFGQEPNMAIRFSDVRFGYWFPESIADHVRKNIGNFADERAQKFLEIGTNASWADVMKASPAEPGLSRTVNINNDMISVGGWGDLSPVQVLKAAGCDKVIYVTRRTPESTFLVSGQPIDRTKRAPHGVAELLNMEESDRLGLFNEADKNSSFGSALTLAGAVWCTDWNRFSDFQTEDMMNEAYDAEMVVNDPFFATGLRPYLKRPAGPVVGCTSPPQ